MDTIIQCGTSDRREALFAQLCQRYPRVTFHRGKGLEPTIELPAQAAAQLVEYCEGFLQGWRKALCYVPEVQP